jgi:hypothetical protein
MLRAFFISVIALSVFAALGCLFFIDEVAEYREASMTDSLTNTPYTTENFSYYHEQAGHITIAAGASTMFYFMIIETVFILSLVRLRKKTMKVIAIIAISLTAVMMLWDGLMISSPNAISFDEVGGAWIIYILIILAFSIVGTIQAFKRRA